MLSVNELSSLDWQTVVSSLTARNVFVYGASGWVVFKVLQALYNISPLHPLSNVPGPKLAAATYWPEFYHDVIQLGRYTREIERMHQKYGLYFCCVLHVGLGLSTADTKTRPHRSHQSQRNALQ
jgi:hypothetical protein